MERIAEQKEPEELELGPSFSMAGWGFVDSGKGWKRGQVRWEDSWSGFGRFERKKKQIKVVVAVRPRDDG